MPQIVSQKPPTGFTRFLFRLPIWLYRMRLGWLLGKRFVLLNHTGRKSGLPRQTVLEVVNYDAATDTYTIAAGFGPQSAWYQNLNANPEVNIQVGRRKMAVTAVLLSPEESGEAMVDYAHRHPKAARNLFGLIGYQVNDTDEDYRALAHDHIPFVELKPR